ncbi:unnamed protein product [Urochloa decumbens]|uniref:F-box domain-containing protein n=1 Tax=Urochloa decumbens TaxID=240449 RepID=A0ABC9AME7_9POAL
MDRLPEDMLAGILGRLDPRNLAVCRCVCKELRGTIEDGRLLQLPRWLYGIFFNYNEHRHSHLLFRPQPPGSPASSVDGLLHFMPGRPRWRWRTLKDHCNGLLLYEDGNTYYVCNPATRRWRVLPPRMENYNYAAAYLVFDPAMSLDYQVVLLPWAPGAEPSWYKYGRVEPLMEWPPAVLEMDVFSSRTERWEARQFVREGAAVVTIADVLSERETPRKRYGGPDGRYAGYWKGALYVHCRGSFVMRLSLLDNSLKATKTPVFVKYNENIHKSLNEDDLGSDVESYLGRSEKGIYYVTLHKFQIWVWSLNESGQLMEWVLQYHSDLAPLCKTLFSNGIQYFNKKWVLADYDSDSEYKTDSDDEVCASDNSDGKDDDDVEDYTNLTLEDLIYSDSEEDNENDGHDESCKGSPQHNIGDTDDHDVRNDGVEQDNEGHGHSQQSSDNSDDNGDGEEDDEEEKYSEWDSDDDYTLEIKNSSVDMYHSDLYFLGFHPYKEVIFLAEYYRVVAYHLGRCKAKYLGHRRPREFGRLNSAAFLESFPYTPCFIDALPHSRDG